LGIYERGADETRQDVDFVASRFRGSQLTFEPFAMGASGDLGHTVWLERGEVRLIGREEYAPLVLRVTHIFCRENGTWKIIHRHGDGVMQRSDTPSVQQRQ
jgi:ketosteroid isomerase-like protein